MDNRELDKFLAEKVMGWLADHYDKEGDWRTGHDEYTGYTINAWHPTTSISDAFQVVEKMESMTNYGGFYLAHEGEKWVASIDCYDDGVAEYDGIALTKELAICTAVYKCMEKPK